MRGSLFYIFDWITGNATMQEAVIAVFADLIILFVCFPVRGFAQAAVAKLCGDDTAERAGRLTLNPLVHLEPFGALMMFICNIGFTKPVPIDLRRCNKVSARTANALISLSGPVANLLMAFILLIPCKILVARSTSVSDVTYIAASMLYYAANILVFLAVLHLLPVPPYDGYRFLSSFMSAKAIYFMERNANIFQILVLVLIFSGVLAMPLSFAADKIMWLLELPLSFIK